MNEWERATETGTDKLKVDGGYIYRDQKSTTLAMCYVPDVDLTRYQAHLRDAYNKGYEDGLKCATDGICSQ
jgi:hypothetical protein